MIIRPLALAILVVQLICIGCREHARYPTGGPYYYKSWASYGLPHRPIDQISYEEAKRLANRGYAYYIAHFDRGGRITSFEKILDGKSSMKVNYEYGDDVVTGVWYGPNGEKTTRTYKP